MATTKKTVKKKARAAAAEFEASTTIRLIERRSPCVREYFAFLLDIGGRPLPDGDFVQNFEAKHPRPGRANFGPLDPIPLELILSVKPRRRDQYSTKTGLERVMWILEYDCVLPNNAGRAFMKRLRSITEAHGRLSNPLAVVAALRLDAQTLGMVMSGIRL